jgi:hypothetical protein
MNFVGVQSTYGSFMEPFTCVSGSGGYAPAIERQGILGMGGDNTEIAGANPWVNVAPAGSQPFAVQLCDLGGQVWFGGYDPSLTQGPPAFVPLDYGYGQWDIFLQSMATSDGRQIAVNSPMLVDTGTSGFGLPATQYQQLVSLLESDPDFIGIFGNDFFSNFNCVYAANSQAVANIAAKIPPLSLALTGPDDSLGRSTTVTLTVPGTHSYIDIWNNSDGSMWLCPALFSGSQIIGDSVLKNFVTVFDFPNKSIGFSALKAGACDAVVAPTTN